MSWKCMRKVLEELSAVLYLLSFQTEPILGNQRLIFSHIYVMKGLKMDAVADLLGKKNMC